MSNKTPNDSQEKTASALRPLTWLLICLLPLSLLAGNNANHSNVCTRYVSDHPLRHDVILHFPNGFINAENVATVASREQGLSGRPCMANDQAMLFTFDPGDQSNHCFWMKDMRFPIDIIWLDYNKKVVKIISGLSPATYPKQYCPEVPTTYVLELHSGMGARLPINIGMVITF